MVDWAKENWYYISSSYNHQESLADFLVKIKESEKNQDEDHSTNP